MADYPEETFNGHKHCGKCGKERPLQNVLYVMGGLDYIKARHCGACIKKNQERWPEIYSWSGFDHEWLKENS